VNRRCVWTFLAVCLVLSIALGAAAQKKESKLRTVHGTVVSKDDNPIGSAVVYLKNARTQVVLTHIADETGHYRFSGLDPNVDYEIHAERDDLTSAKRTISSLDSRQELDFTLKVDKKKSDK
jgi:hypothetical protein